MGAKIIVDWDGTDMSLEQIAMEYNLHRATVGAYFRKVKKSKCIWRGMLALIEKAKSSGDKKYTHGKFKDTDFDMGPRIRNLDLIHSAKDKGFEKSLWK